MFILLLHGPMPHTFLFSLDEFEVLSRWAFVQIHNYITYVYITVIQYNSVHSLNGYRCDEGARCFCKNAHTCDLMPCVYSIYSAVSF